ncbi:MAG TPA: type II toxin-antitoxin system HicA family toxin [Anaerolineae bacterium]|nr:type II toxin-antitoxin system HicA family toxin [Anaerolineae bacterium]
MTRPRLFSSDEVVAALVRAGFVERAKSRGSHLALVRHRAGGGHDVTVVPPNRKQIPRGTFLSILQLANLTEAEFLAFARTKHKARADRLK